MVPSYRRQAALALLPRGSFSVGSQLAADSPSLPPPFPTPPKAKQEIAKVLLSHGPFICRSSHLKTLSNDRTLVPVYTGPVNYISQLLSYLWVLIRHRIFFLTFF